MSNTRHSWRPCTGLCQAPPTCTSTTTTTTITPPAWSSRRRWQCRLTCPCRGPRSPCRRRSRSCGRQSTAGSPSRLPVSAAGALADLIPRRVSMILLFRVSLRLFLGFWCVFGSARRVASRATFP
jgi:hypothetical protein